MTHNMNYSRLFFMSYLFTHESNFFRLFLSVHHTESDNGRDKRVPFKLAGFNKNSDILIATSSRKDLFVFNLNDEKYWCFEEVCKNLACFWFHPHNQDCILVGTKYGSLLNVELCKTTNTVEYFRYFLLKFNFELV